MAKATTSERIRLFVAVDPPKPARRAIARWRDSALASREELRLVGPDALHVTLAFLGWRAQGDVDAIAERLPGSSGGGPLRLAPRALAAVPRRRPRLFALDLDDEEGRCAALQAAVSDALAAGGFYEPEDRPFWPHITLARVRKGARARLPADVGPLPEAFEATALTLYRSTLHPRGARYDALARLPLQP